MDEPEEETGRRVLVWLGGAAEESEPDDQLEPTRREKIAFWSVFLVTVFPAVEFTRIMSGGPPPHLLVIGAVMASVGLARLAEGLSRRLPRRE